MRKWWHARLLLNDEDLPFVQELWILFATPLKVVKSFNPACYSEDGNLFTYDSTSNLVHDSPNNFNPPPQPPMYSWEFCENDAHYGHYCTPQGDEHLDTVPATESDEFIKSSVENLVPILKEKPAKARYWKISICYDDDDNEDYTIAVTHILSNKEPDNFLSMGDEHLDTVPATESDEFIKSSVENLFPILSESEGNIDNMCDVPFQENSPPLDILKDQFEDFSDSNNDSTSIDDDSFSINNIDGSTTTHSNSYHYDSFIFDLSINPFPLADRSDFYEFTDELAHIISPSEYDCFFFKNEPNSGDFTMNVVEDIFPTREPRVQGYNALPTYPTLQLNLDFILSSESFFTYVVWIFLPFLSYSVAPQYLLSFGNEDTIFNPGICSYHISSFMPDVSHWSGAFIKINFHPKQLNGSPMKNLFSTCSPMDH
nr:hypothetical protein [Tanacetum cinerariifolium]